MNYFIGLDSGGTFMKAGLYDSAGELHGLAKVSASVITEKPGWVERNLDHLWSDACSAINNLLDTTDICPTKIKGISISAQGKGVYLIDKKGNNLRNGILSSDSRSLSIVKQWHQEGLNTEIYPTTKQTLWTGHPVSIMRWLKEHEPDNYKNVGAIFMAHDYLRYRLTGSVHAELTNMSESNFFNAQTSDYDKNLLSMFGIEEMWEALPPIIASDNLAGYITDEAALKTRLAPGTPVYGGLFDVVSTALCSGINADNEKLNYVMGTWSVTSGITDKVTQEEYNFVYGYHAIANQYIVHEASPTSASNYEWFCRYFGDENAFDHDSIAKEVTEVIDEEHDVLFVPFLYGSNQGLGLRSGFYGLQSHHTRGDLVKAVWEGILFCHNLHLNRMKHRFPNTDVLRVTGGPTASDVWMQMLANVTGMKVEIPNVQETGALGAAAIAMVGAGDYADVVSAISHFESDIRHFEPQLSKTHYYQKKYARYQKLVTLFKAMEESKDAE